MAEDQAPSTQIGLSEQEAAVRIESILSQTDPEFADEQPPQDSEANEAEADEVEAKTEEAEQPAEDSEESVDEIDYDTLVEVKGKDADGNETTEEVALKDLIKQRMLNSDYTRKTQELAKQRAEVEQSLQKGIEQERAQYLQALDTQQQLIIQLLAPEARNLDQLAEDDPGEYVRAQAKLNRINAVIQQIEQQRQAQNQKQREYLNTNVLPKEKESLQQKIPDWSEDTRLKVVETGRSFGFTENELSQVVDHRFIHLLHETGKLRGLEKTVSDKKAVASKKIVEKPKVVKSGKPVVEKKGSEAFKKLQKSGDYRDAAAYFMETMDDL